MPHRFAAVANDADNRHAEICVSGEEFDQTGSFLIGADHDDLALVQTVGTLGGDPRTKHRTQDHEEEPCE